MELSCTGVGFSYPMSWRAIKIGSERVKSENLVSVMALCSVLPGRGGHGRSHYNDVLAISQFNQKRDSILASTIGGRTVLSLIIFRSRA